MNLLFKRFVFLTIVVPVPTNLLYFRRLDKITVTVITATVVKVISTLTESPP